MPGKQIYINREQAIKKAQAYLVSRNFDLTGYKVSTGLSNSFPQYDDAQYIYEQLGFDKTKKLIQQRQHTFMWDVRFIKPLSPTEYRCTFDENGKFIGLGYNKGEDDPGANLTQKEAQLIAENDLKAHPRINPFVLDDTSVEKRKNRTDYHFTFKVPKLKVKDADFKIRIDVMGDVAANRLTGWDVPDEWSWKRSKHTTREEVFI